MLKYFKKIMRLFLGVNLSRKLISFLDIALFVTPRKSFSQEAEDLIVLNLLKYKKNGFYVDVGAHHPFFYSNTRLLYQMGWSGVNIDANPESIALFNVFRKNDVNLNCGVGQKSDKLTFFNFDESALNTFDGKLANERINQGRRLISKLEIEVRKLEDILDENLSKNQEIDLMSIDVEGLDLDVLKSNNWSKFRPKLLLVECLELNITKLDENLVYRFLKENGYVLKSKLINTCLFESSRI